MGNLSEAWFSIMYPLKGFVFLWFGWNLARKPVVLTNYLIKTAGAGGRPRMILRWLRYFLMATLVSTIVSVWPFRLREFAYAAGCLLLIYLFGRLLLHWEAYRDSLPGKSDTLNLLARRTGFLLIWAALISFVFWYQLLYS